MRKRLTKQLLYSMQNSNVSLICCTNEVYFLLCDSKKEESVAQFEMRLREKADVCEFGDADRVDRVILDQLVPNLCNLELKYKILETEDLTLETALAKAKLFETLRSRVPHMGGK